MVDFKDKVLVFFASLSLLLFHFFTLVAETVLSHGSSFEHDVNFAQFGFIREMSVGLRKSSGHLPCMAFLECTSE